MYKQRSRVICGDAFVGNQTGLSHATTTKTTAISTSTSYKTILRRDKKDPSIVERNSKCSKCYSKRIRGSRIHRFRIMRPLVSGLIAAVLVMALVVLATQVVNQQQQRQSLTGYSNGSPKVKSLTRIPFTKRDLEKIYSQSNEREAINASGSPSKPSKSWYDSLVSPIAGIFGLEEPQPEDELAIIIGSKELRRVRKGHVNYVRPEGGVTNDKLANPLRQQHEQSTRVFNAEINSPAAAATTTTTRSRNDLAHSELAQHAAHVSNTNNFTNNNNIIYVSTTHQEDAAENNRKFNNTLLSASSLPIALDPAADPSYHQQLPRYSQVNHVATIDKIKGIDLDYSKMVNDRYTVAGKEQNRWNRDVKCINNKYDRLIAQKIKLKDISQPIIKSNGRFDNPFASTWSAPSIVDGFKFMFLESDDSNVPKNKDELEKELPMEKPDFNVPKGEENEFRVTWIGHSTLVIQIDGLNILTDPVFSSRASPTQFFGPKRIREPAAMVKDLPHIDAVVISHNHYDHLDADSVKELNDRFGTDIRWIVPLGLGEFMRSMSVDNYVELDWWQKDCFSVDRGTQMNGKVVETHADTTSKASNSSTVASQAEAPTQILTKRSFATTTDNLTNDNSSGTNKQQASRQKSSRTELSIYLTPSQHWSRRGINDINKSLWGSYTIVSGNDSTFFFGGDTAYCSAFKEVAKVFGPMTGAAIPIGAYRPRWFLKSSHVDPHEAVQIHRDLKSAKSMAIHHSTFILSYEPFKEPANALKDIMHDLKASGSVSEPFISLNHGQTEMFRKLIKTPKL